MRVTVAFMFASPSSRLDWAAVNAPWTKGEKTVTDALRVLVVEDEPNIRELVCLHLGLEGYACEGLADGQSALERTESEHFDLLVLDVMIPGIDGLSLCRAIRNGRTNHDVPILMLTARREESDKVVGLESGADDYLTKPFGVRELIARVRALLRRGPRPIARVWKDQTFVTVRSVDTLIKRLRKKIEENPADPAVILTVWGAGYKAADV